MGVLLLQRAPDNITYTKRDKDKDQGERERGRGEENLYQNLWEC